MATQCNTMHHTATHCSTLQHTAAHFNTLQHTATHCHTLQHTTMQYATMQHTATHYNILHHTATHCNTLQRTATHCNTLQHRRYAWHTHRREGHMHMRSFNLRGGVRAFYFEPNIDEWMSCCSVMQYVVVCCRVCFFGRPIRSLNS